MWIVWRCIDVHIPKHINTYCTFCKALGELRVPALWRLSDDQANRACEGHREALVEIEKARDRVNGREYSEGDYQTWVRL
jgi:ribosomal protein L44E